MKCAASAGGTFNHFIVGQSAVNTRPRPGPMGRSRDIAGENAAGAGRIAGPTLARESRYIVPLKLSGTTSRFAADRFLSSIE